MLPVYRAISFNKVILKGGRTLPWVILVNADNSLKPYVVKLFETSLIESRDSVTNEVLGNVLAREFNLPVPAAAFIDLDEDFISTITDQQLLETLDSKDGRLKFGSEYKEGFLNFDVDAYTLNDVRKIIDIDSVFAFDNLIRNADRNGKLKPNILIRSTEAYLIDHELGFDNIGSHILSELHSYRWDRKFSNYHIFNSFLKNSTTVQKKEYFNEFEEYLKYLNISILKTYFQQLIDNGFSNRNHKLITDYLTEIRHNSTKFVGSLKRIIQ